jgi:peptide/nickel transport system ATP-binding protein
VSGQARAGGGPLLEVADLRVSFGGALGGGAGAAGARAPAGDADGTVRVVRGVSFALDRGEVLALVGESGSGKSVCAMSLLGLVRSVRMTVSGSALLDGEQLIGAGEQRLRRLRGAQAAMVFQDPMSSLNPVMRVGEQIAEQIRAHEPTVGRAAALERAGELMERLQIPDARRRVRAYPHELSGGMRQRVMIAMALSLQPKLLLADEPTTALDVAVQREILDQLDRLRAEEDMGVLLITHDFAVVAQLADRVAVMKAGEIVEQGNAAQVLDAPRHEYTRTLLDALVPPPRRRPRGSARAAGPVARVEDLRVRFKGAATAALDGVTLDVLPGETLAIVGESGCGKTTLLRCLARLVEPDAGLVYFGGQEIGKAPWRRLRPLRRQLGMVFQDPQASLNPRRRVGRTLARALRARGVAKAQADAQALELLRRVGLDASYAGRFPYELSGGERQRVAIARALAGEPKLVLLDEPVSSLDAALRRGVIELLADLQEQIGCAYVLVSHDLAIVAGVADRIAVMSAGRLVEVGDAEDVGSSGWEPLSSTRAMGQAGLPQIPPDGTWPTPPHGSRPTP